MKGINLQVYMDVDLRRKVEDRATDLGFSSLQDLVRFMIKGVADGRYVPTLLSNTDTISENSEERLIKELRQFEKKRSISSTAKHSARELVKELES